MNVLNTLSPEAKISFEQRQEFCAIYNETTYARNQLEFASYIETVLHVMRVCYKGEMLLVYRAENSKWIGIDMLDQMVADGLMVKRPNTSRWTRPEFIRAF